MENQQNEGSESLNQTTPAIEPVAGNTGDQSAANGNAESTPKPVAPVQPAVNYESKYKELQRAYTQETQRRSQVEKQWSAIQKQMEQQAKHLSELRKQPFDRDKFLTEFQEKGPDALKPFIEDSLSGVREEYSKGISESQAEGRALRTKIALMERRSDSEGYPDFKKLEPVIAELLEDPNTPVDFSKPIDQVIDILYSLARQTSSAEAIRQAEAAGAASAENKLVRESKTTVTGGGKSASITKPDISKMTVQEMRDYAIKTNGLVDRD